MHAAQTAGLIVAMAGAAAALHHHSPAPAHEEETRPIALTCEPAQPEPAADEPFDLEILLRPPEPEPPRRWDIRPPISIDHPAAEPASPLGAALLHALNQQRLAQAFMPVEAGGLLAQITGISASVSMGQTRFGSPGAQCQRSISISGGVYDLSGTRAFRIVAAPRLLELTDETGESLLGAASWRMYPDETNPQPFTSPNDSPGSMQQQGFSVQAGDLARVPHAIGTLRLALDVATAGPSETYLLRLEPSQEFTRLAPGIEARVTMVRSEGDYAQIGFEYRLKVAEGSRPFLLRAEVLDDEKRPLATASTGPEAHGRDWVMGAAACWGVDTGEAPAWYVRLEIIASGQVQTIEISERDLPLMGM